MLRLFPALLLFACAGSDDEGPTPPSGCEALPDDPSDDPSDWEVDPAVDYEPVLSEPRWVVPSDALPIATQASNNNVNIQVVGDRVFLAWRTSPSHFASEQSELHVIRSDDGGASWVHEHSVALESDVREPHFLLWEGVLSLSFFEAGTNPFAFEPVAIWRAERCAAGDWTDARISEGEQVPWDLKVRGGVAYRTSYSGPHYAGRSKLDVHFTRSTDGGVTWAPVTRDPVLTDGGDSEVAFELDEAGGLWAVTRNEDGDDTGKGSKVCTAPASDLGAWTCPDVSDPERYDSPELIRHGDDLYLLARRDVGGPFGDDTTLLEYSARPKRSALYRIDRATREVVHVADLPGVGDTAFVSARRTGPHTWLIANYTSPLDDPDVTWLEAQTSPRGTQIYLAELSFVPAR